MNYHDFEMLDEAYLSGVFSTVKTFLIYYPQHNVEHVLDLYNSKLKKFVSLKKFPKSNRKLQSDKIKSKQGHITSHIQI